ncbi:MAG: hypothetical protein Q4F79_10500 [Eubacteriales bacterium]|nr:hypothetical protein [Eubacteriales bacterium]
MKKRVVSLFLLVALSVGLIAGTAAPAQAASAATKAKQKYKSYVTKKNGSFQYAKIIDIDGNGIPELLYNDWSNTSTSGKTYVYTYNKSTKKMVKLKSMYFGKGYAPYYNKKKHMVVLTFFTTRDGKYAFYKVSGKKITKDSTYYAKRGATGAWKYTINGKKVSQSTYSKKLNAKMKGYNVAFRWL